MSLKLLLVKKTLVWFWTAVNKHVPGVIAWVLGDRSSKTFKQLLQIISCWHSYFYVTDGYSVYPCFISDEDHIVSKTYMTRVEGENSRFRHYLARLHRKTFCYSSSEEMLKLSIRLVIHYLKYGSVALRRQRLASLRRSPNSYFGSATPKIKLGAATPHPCRPCDRKRPSYDYLIFHHRYAGFFWRGFC